MGLYTRADYEADIAASEALRIGATRDLLAHTIDGFTKLKIDSWIDTFQLKCKGRLFGTSMRMRDKAQVKKDVARCYESNHKCDRSYCACKCHKDKGSAAKKEQGKEQQPLIRFARIGR